VYIVQENLDIFLVETQCGSRIVSLFMMLFRLERKFYQDCIGYKYNIPPLYRKAKSIKLIVTNCIRQQFDTSNKRHQDLRETLLL